MKRYYALLLILSFIGCQRNKNVIILDSDDIANIEIKEYPFGKQKFFDSDKYFDSIKYVYLEETDESIIPCIEQILFTDNRLIIVSKSAGAIFFFNHDGKYLNKINKRGRGHGEYLTQEKVMVDQKQKEVIVYDRDTKKILYYDFNGNFLKAIDNFSNGAVIRDIINSPNGGFICYSYSYYDDNKKLPAGLWKVDSNGKFDRFISELKNYYPARTAYGLTNLTHLQGDTIGFLDSNIDETYHLINDSIYCRSRYEMPGKRRADYVGIEDTEDDFIDIFKYEEKGNYIFMKWGVPSEKKGAGQLFQTALCKSDNTVETGLMFTTIMKEYLVIGGISVDNNNSEVLTSWVELETLKKVNEHQQDSIIRSALKNVVDAAPESTNIVIQITYVKK